ncbi:uncharacterized protein Dana_GF14312 [Drosophila ananassae]|uniref:Coiled-coil domain-containing protein n=1 Tax=Drosophila ananassae TaxID=7217 RepID=B3MMD8_DROAN|nr:vicilin-like seed storage protein At2g18540 [Drosophila ananassae]EDV31898.1 uncharacterized protein Dana_GF14312 [Drosophila ananassae]
MAFCGHVDEYGELIIREEIYSSRTLLRRSTSSSTESPMSQSSPEATTPSVTSRTYSMKCDTDDLSLESWSTMYKETKQSVPSLIFSSHSSSMNYMHNVDKVRRNPKEAYDNWYSAKQRLREKEIVMLKQEQQYGQQQAEMRKRLAQESYEMWLRNKAQVAAIQRYEEAVDVESISEPTSESASSANRATKLVRGKRNVSQDEVRQVVENWRRKKLLELQAQREKKRREMLSKEQEEERRKVLAEAAWKKWISKVSQKPKPVPLNQGIDSLRGTISKLYVNPQRWQDPLKEVTAETAPPKK